MNFKEVKIFIRVMATFLRNLAGIVNKKLFIFSSTLAVVITSIPGRISTALGYMQFMAK